MYRLLIAILLLLDGIISNQRSTVYLPLVSGGDGDPSPVLRYTTLNADLWQFYDPFGVDVWCRSGIECRPTPSILGVWDAPPGYVISFVRLFSYEWGVGGAHFIYPYEGCVAKVCLDTPQGSFAEKNVTQIEIYIGQGDGWGEPIHLLDLCLERAGDDYRQLCDLAWGTAAPVYSPR